MKFITENDKPSTVEISLAQSGDEVDVRANGHVVAIFKESGLLHLFSANKRELDEMGFRTISSGEIETK